MRFATRTFLWSFLPFALLLIASFWAIQTMVLFTVKDGLRLSLRETQVSMDRIRARSELQNSRFLRVVGENPALKAGMQLLLADPTGADARRTVEDQLREICSALSFDFLLVASNDNTPLAGVVRAGSQLLAMDTNQVKPPRRGFFTSADHTYQVTSVPVNQGDEAIGTLTVGELFDFAEFTTPVALTHNGKVLKSSIHGKTPHELENALAACKESAECELRLAGETYVSMPMESISFGDGYLLRTLQNLDRANDPVQTILHRVFMFAGLGALAAAIVLAGLSSRSVVQPIAGVVSHLRHSAETGEMPEFRTKQAPIVEIRELTDSFNRAATAIREARGQLHEAYVEFIKSLASALDARDPYTSGHSQRVSQYSCAIAEALQVAAEQLDDVRIGALLHDIGKIGIADSVLQKPGRLTEEEFRLIQQHPVIGRRILESVHGFHPYLPTVELHHENWDGTGYPIGLSGEAVPLAARIVHVADAYDAMTSDRPYRPGMSHDEAINILQRFAGTQFDPHIVRVFVQLQVAGSNDGVSLRKLAEAVTPAETPVPKNV